MADDGRRQQVRERLLGRMPKGGVAAEIGVWEGRFSDTILRIAEPRELHLIDPWLYQPEFNNTGFGRKKNETRMEEMFAEVSARFAPNPAVKIHRAKSDDALAAFPDGHFDWVYVDGNHNAPFIGNDLALCRRKVRPGGIIAGDDFGWGADAGAPVRTAVEALVADLGPRARFRLIANQYLITLPG
jgi:SAM-dependent methyltransferase